MPVQEQGTQPVEGLVNTYSFVCLCIFTTAPFSYTLNGLRRQAWKGLIITRSVCVARIKNTGVTGLSRGGFSQAAGLHCVDFIPPPMQNKPMFP